MKRFVRIAAIAVGSLVGLLVLGVAGVYAWTGVQLRATRDLPAHTFVAPTDSASVARGEHILQALAKCADCHGADLGGSQMIDDPAFGRVFAANLTRGAGGVGARYTDADFERAIRHGLASDGRRLVIMPALEYQNISDEDLGALIAYLRSVDPVDREPTPVKLGPVARGLMVAKVLPIFSADIVTHREEVVATVAVDSTVEYGKYIGDVGCMGCHGAGYGGGKIPGTPPDMPPPANLTPTGIGHYTFADFDRVMREGVRPDGSKLNSFMPTQATRLMTEVEMVATWKYLRSLEPRAYGTR